VLLLWKLRRVVRRKPVTVLVPVATHELEMLARLDCDMLNNESIPAGINYAPAWPNPRQRPFEVVVPEAFAERARQLVSATRH
jgi:hypothetical protein